MKKYIIILCFLAGNQLYSYAQDAHFSQFFTAPLYLGPSFAGATKGSRIVANYRNQWPIEGLRGVYETFAFSFDHYFHKYKSGLGGLVFRDQSGKGQLGTTNFALQYSYDVIFKNDWHLRPGLYFAYTQRSIDIDPLIFPDELSTGVTSIEVPPEEKHTALDFGSSLLLHGKNFWFGFSVDHLTQPNQSLYGEESMLPMKITIYGGSRTARYGRLRRTLPEYLNYSFIFKKQDKYHQLDIGGYWFKDPIIFGSYLRWLPLINNLAARDALILLGGYKVENYSLLYSFDLTISNLLLQTRGSHEISLMYEFNQEWEKRIKPKYRPVPCPEF
ncbi:type IX secretion system membrane protein PorP/SprF [Bacteroidota bacterium]